MSRPQDCANIARAFEPFVTEIRVPTVPRVQQASTRMPRADDLARIGYKKGESRNFSSDGDFGHTFEVRVSEVEVKV